MTLSFRSAASSPAKRSAALAAGARQAIDRTLPDWYEQLKQLTQNQGVNVVFEPGGSTAFTDFHHLALGGRHLVRGGTTLRPMVGRRYRLEQSAEGSDGKLWPAALR